jgi:Ca2+-binding EF-hand superfamily protein
MMEQLGRPISLEEARKIINAFDTNHDGVMGLEEFLSFLGY